MASKRIEPIDALRGVAIVLMIVYHFCFDLRFFHLTRWNFEHDPFWLAFRALIVSLFMLLVGVSLVLAQHMERPSKQFWRRVAIIALCALVASAASYFVFPRSFIFFGVLHAIAVTSVLARPLVRHPVEALIIGAVVIVAGIVLSHPVFDHKTLAWVGFTTSKPNTEDYVPLAPWGGVACVGVALGNALIARHFRPLAPLAETPRWLRWAGRHSLAIYMVHQPILLGTMWVLLQQ